MKKKKKRKKPVSATQKSLKVLRKFDWHCAVVEKIIPKCFIKQDLFGFIDILAIRDDEVLAVQTTAGGGSGRSNFLARIKKIKANENFKKVKKVGWRVIVHGWQKKNNKWELEEIEL